MLLNIRKIKKIKEKIKSVVKLGHKVRKKTEHQLFLDFMKNAKEKMNSEFEKAMLNYLDEVYHKAVDLQKKEEKKEKKISAWISRDLEIEQEKKREQEYKENNFIP